MKDKLLKIQSELKAPKEQRNDFGRYNYRSCEDIFEAVKPLLAKEGLLLRMTDELVNIGERYYIKATAIITDGNETIENTAYAREELDKKGMDGSQITGASSSYARKYALNGLLLIDDTKDSDATNTHGKLPDIAKLLEELQTLVVETDTDYEKLLNYYKVSSDKQLNETQIKEAIAQLKKKVK